MGSTQDRSSNAPRVNTPDDGSRSLQQMGSLSIYSIERPPTQLYAVGQTTDAEERPPLDRVTSDGRLMELLVEFEDSTTRVLWVCNAIRPSQSDSLERFVVDVETDRTEPFRAFYDMLMIAVEDGWEFPSLTDPRWDIGFVLWRTPPDATLTQGDQDAVNEFIRSNAGPPEDDPLVFGMTSVRAALAAVRSLEQSELDCTVAVDSYGISRSDPEMDLVFVPGSAADWEPQSSTANELLRRRERDQSTTAESPEEASTSSRHAIPDLVFAGAFVIVILLIAGAVPVLLSPGGRVPLNPITVRQALAITGGVLGSLLSFLTVGRWLTLEQVLDSEPGSTDTDASTATPTKYDPSWGVLWIGYGTFWGLAYPLVFYFAYKLTGVGQGWHLLGDIATLRGGLPSILVFIPGLYVISMIVLSTNIWTTDGTGVISIRRDTIWKLSIAHVIYGVCLFLVTTVPAIP